MRGSVDRITFRNAQNGYSVLQVSLEDSNEKITAVGMCPHAKVGSHVMMNGSFIVHPKFGRQFTITTLTETAPSTPAGIERYLASGLIAGIGKKTAERIVKEFGTSSLEMIRTEPDKVAALTGVGRKKAGLLQGALAQQSEFDQIMRFLVEHRISPALSVKIYERFKNKTVQTVEGDPYVLAREIRGIGFHTADTIALNIGFDPQSPKRLRAGIQYALEEGADDGHCYLTRPTLLERARNLLGIEGTEHLGEHLEALLSEALLTQHGEITDCP